MIPKLETIIDFSIAEYERLDKFRKEVEKKTSDKNSIFCHSKIIKAYLKQLS